MTSEIFQNLDADEQAVKNVQREIKRFAKDRMEVMLGMKEEVKEASVFAQFNSLTYVIVIKLDTVLDLVFLFWECRGTQYFSLKIRGYSLGKSLLISRSKLYLMKSVLGPD
jgi:hypothetical protein